MGTSGGSNSSVSIALPTAAPTGEAPVVEMDVGDAPTKGPADAKVQIVEFSDFECPYCAKFVTQTMPQILSTYGDKVLFAFRNYPLPASMHPYAQKAAEASECANDQGKFWEYHDLLFQNQSQLSALVQADPTNGVNQVADQLKQYAASLSLDTAKFNQCLDSGADAEKVSSDASAMTEALTKAGVTRFGTPSFFINGKFISGAYPFDETSSGYQEGMFTFKGAIEEALAAAK
jgi:protein-disulfide isomerase